MKKIYLFLLLLFPLSLFAQEHYYYYKGEKQYLQLDTNYLFVSTTNSTALQKEGLSKVQGTLVVNKEQTSNLLKQKQGVLADFYWAELNLGKEGQKELYAQQKERIRKIEGIQVVSPYFKGKDGSKIGLSNFFYVKLKSLSDTTLLNNYSKENHVVVVRPSAFMPLWFLLSCTKQTEGDAMQMANKYYESNLFQYAEPDLMVEDLLGCANDPYFPNQWGLRNTGQDRGTPGVDIKACEAWNYSTGLGVTVAVLDQGIERTHPDLQANIHSLSYDTENGTSPSIVRGSHGTACAGIIGAAGNSIGIKGLAPNSKLMSISNSLSSTPASRMKRGEGIDWAVQNGADIINNSWSSSIQHQIIDDAITNAITNGRNGLGCVVIFASGNDNGAVNYPANSNPNILVVGAISPCGQRKSPSSCDGEQWGSNYGAQLDIVAPGVLIPTTDLTGNNGYNPNTPIHPNNGGRKISSDYSNRDYTVWFNGTSAAAPHVAGVAALMLSANPNLTGQQVRTIIERTAQKVGDYSYTTTPGRSNGTWNNEMGYGLVDASAAVLDALLYSVTISGPDVFGQSCQASYQVGNLPPNISNPGWETTGSLVVTQDNGVNGCTVGRSSVLTPGTSSTIRFKFELNGQAQTVEKQVQSHYRPSFHVFDTQTQASVGTYQTGRQYHFVSYTTPKDLIRSYSWELVDFEEPIITLFSQENTSNEPIRFATPTAHRLTLKVYDGCGLAGKTSKTLYVTQGAGYYSAAYPNPASSSLTIERVQNNEDVQVKNSKPGSAATVQLYNQSKRLVREEVFNNNRLTLDVSALLNGTYFLNIIENGKVVEQQTVIVQH